MRRNLMWGRRRRLAVRCGKRLAALALAAVICGSEALTALADEADMALADEVDTALADEADTNEAATLADNILEYSEIQAMIHNYNPSVQQAMASYNANLDSYADAYADLQMAESDASISRKNARDNDDNEDSAYYSMELAIYKASVHVYKKIIDNMQTNSSTSGQRQLERRMTIAAQSLMISYESLKHQRDTVKKQHELYEKQYQLTQVKLQAGMATEADVLAARKQALSAETALSSIEASLDSVYDSLCSMVGHDLDGSLTIADMPAADLSRADGMNLEEDTKKAIGNNQTLINDRHTLSGATTSGAQNKQRYTAAGEEKLTVKMKSLYEDVLQKKNELQAASTAYEKASQEKQLADTKYSIGVLSEEEYLSAEMSWLSGVAAYKAADLAFTQSMETYDWAILGFAEIE